MFKRTVVTTCVAVLVIAVGSARAERNPIKPVKKAQKTIPSMASPANVYSDCGTYKGNENQNRALVQLDREIKQKRAKQQRSSAAPPSSFIYDDVWIIEDDGTLATSGLNAFDTDNQTIRFTPNGNGTYTASSVTFTWDAVLGTSLGLTDDDYALRSMLFSFDFYGTGYTSVYINSNGALTFGDVMNPIGFYDPGDFYSSTPKIAGYYMDLDPEASPGGQVYWKSEATKATITWNLVREYGTTTTNTYQMVLYNDGSFDITYNGINSDGSALGALIVVGVHPGGSPTLELMSFSDDLPFTSQVNAGFYERYLNIIYLQVNEVGLIGEFYNNFGDDYFQISFFTNFIQTMGGFANELNISNSIQGIGLGTFDNSAAWGSGGVLESRCNMNRLAAWPTDPETRFFSGDNSFLTIMGQEAGHRWGSFVCFYDAGLVGTDPGCADVANHSSMLLGRAYAHWSYFGDLDHSSAEGGNWEHVSGSLYTCPTQIDYYSDIDEYIFGFRLPSEVTPTFYVSSPTNDALSARSQGTPLMGATATGTGIAVTVNDIIGAEGARVPTADTSPKDLRTAFIVLLRQGTSLSQADKDKIADFRKSWEDYCEKSLDGRMTMSTSITEDRPVGVVEGLVRDSGNNPLSDITVKALERGFDQYVVSGGRYTMRFQQDSLAAPDTACATLVFSSPGYQPDTLVCCFPYDTTITKDVTLFGTISGIDDDKPVPLASTLLHAPVPNPFNPRTTLSFLLRQSGPIHLGVYDTKGRLVRTLYRGVETSGEHTIDWDGRSDAGTEVSSGIYFVRLEAAGAAVQSQKVVFLK
jgi:hypothetical protein